MFGGCASMTGLLDFGFVGVVFVGVADHCFVDR